MINAEKIDLMLTVSVLVIAAGLVLALLRALRAADRADRRAAAAENRARWAEERAVHASERARRAGWSGTGADQSTQLLPIQRGNIDRANWEDELLAGTPSIARNPHYHCATQDTTLCPTGEHVNPAPHSGGNGSHAHREGDSDAT